MNHWEIRDKIEKIVDENIKEIPYEGTSIEKADLIDDLIELIEEIIKDDGKSDNPCK